MKDSLETLKNLTNEAARMQKAEDARLQERMLTRAKASFNGLFGGDLLDLISSCFELDWVYSAETLTIIFKEFPNFELNYDSTQSLWTEVFHGDVISFPSNRFEMLLILEPLVNAIVDNGIDPEREL
jgi:hypothetical protein